MKIKQMMIMAAAVCMGMVQTACTAQAAATDAPKEKKEICVQLYSVRDLLPKPDSLEPIVKQLAAMGYTSVEAANYGDGKFYGRTPQEFKALIEKYGMEVLSSHVGHGLSAEELASGNVEESLKWWDQTIADHKAAGMKYIVMPWMDVPKTLKDMQTYCDYFNEIGRRCQAAGMKFGYHNHAHEFQKIEDKEVMYDYMLQHTDPALVFFEMDVYWVVRGQAAPVEYFKKCSPSTAAAA